MSSNRQRIIDFVRQFPGRDDDEIAKVLGISPRQQVNAVCRELVRRGVLVRRGGPLGKIANYPASPAVRPSPPPTMRVEADAEGELAPAPGRPQLTREILAAGGFSVAGAWALTPQGLLELPPAVPADRGVYAFVIGGRAMYVGVASMGLRKRLRFYAKPGATQRTSQRLNALLREELAAGRGVTIHTASPPDLSWNGLPVNGSAGLEIGLLEAFHLPWNIRGAG